MIYTKDQFLQLIQPKKVSFEEFSKKISVLNGSDKSGKFVVRCTLDDFIKKVSKKPGDNRPQNLQLYKQKLYQALVIEPEVTLSQWFDKVVAVDKPLEHYFQIPQSEKVFVGDTFVGRTLSKCGRISKNINFEQFYNTKKLHANDFEYTFGLMKVMFEDFKIRNSLASPAFFAHILEIQDSDYSQFWTDFMFGCNKASIFNPATYKGIVENLFKGETLFAPCMGWNAYQIGFYSTNWKKFISTDVIPAVVENGNKLHQHWSEYNNNLIGSENKQIDLYLCPSEKLQERHNFIDKYREQVDAVLFSPPYYDLEIYPGEEQSINSYPDYNDWLVNYWEKTVLTCLEVMRPKARFAFVISNYKNVNGEFTSISQDMKTVAEKHLDLIGRYKVQWGVHSSKRQPKKTRDGNFEDLWLFEKK